jgi:hypothetical protein
MVEQAEKWMHLAYEMIEREIERDTPQPPPPDGGGWYVKSENPGEGLDDNSFH